MKVWRVVIWPQILFSGFHCILCLSGASYSVFPSIYPHLCLTPFHSL
jgi:hypothetical protein